MNLKIMNPNKMMGGKVKDARLAPKVDYEYMNSEPYGAVSDKYNTFEYKEQSAILRCEKQGGEWMVFIENIGGEPSFGFGKAGGLKVDDVFNAWGEIPSRVLEIISNRDGEVYVEDISEDLTTLPQLEVSDSRRVKDDAGNLKWIATAEVDLRTEDENGVFSSERFYSKSKNKDYTWEEMMDNEETQLYSELCDTEDEAWDCAMDLLWQLVKSGYKEDGFLFHISQVEVDENGDIVDWVQDYESHNAWYNEYKGVINYN